MSSGNKTPEQLEAEADAMLQDAGLLPPAEAKPESEDEPKEPLKAETPTEVETETDTESNTDDDESNTGTEVEANDTESTPKAKADDTDELDGLTLENVKERIRNAQARMHRATQEAAEYRRQNADLTVHLRELESQVETLQTELETARANPQAETSDSDKSGKEYADLEALAEDYPSLIKPLLATVKALESKITALGGKVDEKNGSDKKRETEEANRRRAAAVEKHVQTILKAHPDAYKINDTDEFQGWLDRQPQMYRVAMKQGSAADVIDVLDKYKAAVGIAKKKDERDTKAREAATPATPKARTQPTTKNKPTFTQAQIRSMSPEEFARREEEIDLAVAEGRVT